MAALYEQSEKDQKTLNLVYDRVWKMVQIRNKAYRYFNDRNLVQYVDDSTKRWNGYIPPRDDLTMDWQTRIFNNFTRNFVISYLSQVAMKRPQAKFVATDEQGYMDMKRSHIVEKLVEYSHRREDGDWKFLMAALECVTKGTVIKYEGYKKIKRKIKEIQKVDLSTGEVDFKTKEIWDYNDPYSEVVPIEDFYVSDIFQPDIQFQPYVALKRVIKISQAEFEFSRYKKWNQVQAGSYSAYMESTSFFRDKIQQDLNVDQVEVVDMYERLEDRRVLCVNGIVLYDGPIPFHHKEYPFAKAINEPFSSDFFYGKSLPDKISREQDIVNTLWQMMLDQGLLSIYKPVLSSDPDSDGEDIVEVPGLIKKVADVNAYRVLNEFTGPDQSSFNLLNLAMRFAGDNAGNPLGGGGSEGPRGGKITARQALLVEEQTRKVLNLNSRLLEKMETDANRLRAKTLLQFYTSQKVADVTGLNKEQFIRRIRIDDSKLSDGTHGTTIVKIASKKSALPMQEDVAIEEEMAELQNKNVEVFVITQDYIRNLDIQVQTIPESSYLQSKSINQALALEFYELMRNEPLANKEENLREIVLAYDKDPERFMMQQPLGGMPGMPMDGAAPPAPTPQIASQMLGRNTDRSLEAMV